MHNFSLIGACCGNNCGPKPGCNWGPVEYIHRYNPGFLPSNAELIYESWCRQRHNENVEQHTGYFCNDLANAVGRHLAAGQRPIILGGDHSCAIGTWKGASRAVGQRLGMIWIDAHLDSHTPATSHSGAIHGMPVAALCGFGSSFLASKSLNPEHVCIIGARSYEPEEVEFAEKHGVTVITMQEIQRDVDALGREAAYAKHFKRAYEVASSIPGGKWGISLDLDGLDPTYSPSVSCICPDGLHLGEVSKFIARPEVRSELVALEIVEFNPTIGQAGSTGTNERTAETISDLLESYIQPYAFGLDPERSVYKHATGATAVQEPV